MMDKELDHEFKEAFKRASETSLRFPPDLMLHFYAYYKRATGDNTPHQLENLDETQLVGAFKMNALFQVKHLSQDEAKKKYISLVNKHIPK
ncbi:acyl-CoA-binding protein [Mesonia aquimarina]|uniref:acyl-CoA-binding protein n=1 Tax=Mesonia aquimarina TaxID=1504967 RepID=UPI000EF5BAE8|nr:acyl-CoA-binding protein [Mesonia aquimarina]